MRCRECETHLQSYLDHGLTGAVLAAVKRHLGRCPACRQTLDERRVIPAVPALQVAEWTPPPGFVERTVSAAARTEHRLPCDDPRRAGRRMRLILGGLLAATLVLWLVPGSRRPLGHVPTLLANSTTGWLADVAMGARYRWVPSGTVSGDPQVLREGERVVASPRMSVGPVDGTSELLLDPQGERWAANTPNAADDFILAAYLLTHPELDQNLKRAEKALSSANRAPQFTLYRAEAQREALGFAEAPAMPRPLLLGVLAEGEPVGVWSEASQRILATLASLGADGVPGRRGLLEQAERFGARLRDQGESTRDILAGAQMHLTAGVLARAQGSPAPPDLDAQMRRSTAVLNLEVSTLPTPFTAAAGRWVRLQLRLACGAGAAALAAALLLAAGLLHRLCYLRQHAPAPLRLSRGQWAGALELWVAMLVVVAAAAGSEGVLLVPPAWVLWAPAIGLALISFGLLAAGGRHARSLGLPRFSLAGWIDQMVEEPSFRLSPRWDYVRRGWLALDWRLAAASLGLALTLQLGLVANYRVAESRPSIADPIAHARQPFDEAMRAAETR